MITLPDFTAHIHLEPEHHKYNIVQFSRAIASVFSLNFLQELQNPLLVGLKNYSAPDSLRLLHYCIKLDVDAVITLGEVAGSKICAFVADCMHAVEQYNLPLSGRYIYLTVDQGFVDPGSTLRTPGWHIDGLQGDEVVAKSEADYQFIRSNVLPTEFVAQMFDVSNIDVSKHNVFDALSRQIDQQKVYTYPDNSLVLMNAYHVHRASVAKERVYRIFLRLSFTTTPVTSVKMTINPSIQYNYQIHSTSGEIPKHLQ